MAFYTYIMASAPYGTLYCGHTDSIAMRAWQHREKVRRGFTAKYDVTKLVWYELHDTRTGLKPVSGRSRSGTAPGRSN